MAVAAACTTIKFDGGTLRMPVALITESRVLETIMDAEEHEELDFSASGLHVTQETLDIVQHLVAGETLESVTENQWADVSRFADWLDMDRLHGAVVTHYKSWLSKDPKWVSRWHLGVNDINAKIDLSLAKRVIGDTISESKHVCALAAEQDSEWKSTIFGSICRPMTCLAVLPDGRLAFSSYDYTIQLWNIDTNSHSATLRGHTCWVSFLAVLYDGRLASVTPACINLWNVVTGMCTATLSTRGMFIVQVAGLPDGQLASFSHDGSIRLWNIVTNSCTATLQSDTKITTITALPDGRFASGHSNGIIKLWRTEADLSSTNLIGPVFSVNFFAVLFDGRLAAGYLDGSIKIWNTTTGECTATLVAEGGEMFGLTVLPDHRLVSATFAGKLQIWNPDTYEIEYNGVIDVRGLPFPFKFLVGLRDGRLLAVGRKVCVWDARTHEWTAVGHDPGWVIRAALLPDNRIAVLYGFDGHSIYIVNCSTRAHDLLCTGVRVLALVGIPDGRLAVGCHDGAIMLFDTNTSVGCHLTGHTDSVQCLVVLRNGLLASGSADQTIRVWDMESLCCLHVMGSGIHTAPIVDLLVLLDNHLVAITKKFQVHVWCTNTNKHVHEFTAECSPIIRPLHNDNLETWIQRFTDAASYNRDKQLQHQIKISTALLDGRKVQVIGETTLQVQGSTILHLCPILDVIVNDDRSLVVVGSRLHIVNEVASRANVFLALTAAGVPPCYILKVLSH